MKQPEKNIKPRAREEGIVVKELADEVLVYDTNQYKAHCLSQTAALVWKNCNGRRTVPEIAEILRKQTGTQADQVVWYALDQLGRADLLEGRVKRPANTPVYSRRQLLGRIGVAALLSVPLIVSIPVPASASAATVPCVNENQCSQPGTNCFGCFPSSGGTGDCNTNRCCNGNCRDLSAAHNACGCT
jgi:hypothetical protein